MRARFFISIAALGALTATAWAGERVTLRNGYEMHCNHHADVEGHVRLYLGAGEDNFIEFAPQEISTFEQFGPSLPKMQKSLRLTCTKSWPRPAATTTWT